MFAGKSLPKTPASDLGLPNKTDHEHERMPNKTDHDTRKMPNKTDHEQIKNDLLFTLVVVLAILYKPQILYASGTVPLAALPATPGLSRLFLASPQGAQMAALSA